MCRLLTTHIKTLCTIVGLSGFLGVKELDFLLSFCRPLRPAEGHEAVVLLAQWLFGCDVAEKLQITGLDLRRQKPGLVLVEVVLHLLGSGSGALGKDVELVGLEQRTHSELVEVHAGDRAADSLYGFDGLSGGARDLEVDGSLQLLLALMRRVESTSQ